LPLINDELSRIHAAHGDHADARDDYQSLESEWSTTLELLATTPAVSPKGMIAKAAALMHHAVGEDVDRHHDIAISLALDILKHFSV
jgi:hypothetical protein